MISDTTLHILFHIHLRFIINSKVFLSEIGINGTLSGYILILTAKVFYVSVGIPLLEF